eukprot:gene1618-1646_t
MAGELADAALIAGAIDHESAGHGAATAAVDDGHTHETACLNCATPLTGAFCHACGQAAHVHRTLGAFFHDLLHGVFHFEGRIWHTLPLLALRPGALTRRYIEGQRTRFVSPLALFLFCVFMMFAVIQQNTHNTKMNLDLADRQSAGNEAKLIAQLRQLTAERANLIAHHQQTGDVDARLAALRTIGIAMQAGKRPTKDSLPVVTGIPQIDTGVATVRNNPELAFYKVETHAYKYSWLLILISVPMVWLLFPFSQRFALYNHTVFVTYSISFMMLLSVAVIALGHAGWESAAGCAAPMAVHAGARCSARLRC